MKKINKFSAIILICSFCFLQGCPCLAKAKAKSKQLQAVAICSNGKFIGQEAGNVFKWQGIPYAVAPVGSLRWKAPVAAKDSKAKHYLADDTKMPLQAWQPLKNTTEDCLKLNVYTGADNRKNKPVIVFLAPSDFCYGGACFPYSDATSLIESHPEIVFVCPDIRLGIMGSLDLEGVSGYEKENFDTNILWLLDACCALKWIQKNIKSFGGDPNNVTLLGVGSGATIASLLPLLPDTKGLFQKMILESGNPALVTSSEQRHKVTEKLMELTKSGDFSNLMALSGEELSSAMPQLDTIAKGSILGSLATTQEIYKLYEDGIARGIPMLIGTTKDECEYFKAINGTSKREAIKEFQEKYKSAMKRLPSAAQKAATRYMSYQKGKTSEIYEDFFTDTIFTAPALLLAKSQSSHAPTYLYRIDFASKRHGSAFHLSELPYVMNLAHEKWSEKEKTFAKTMTEMWVNFAKTGIPSTDYYRWHQYTKQDAKMLVFGVDGAISIETEKDEKKCKLLAPLLPYTHIFCEEYFQLDESSYKKLFVR